MKFQVNEGPIDRVIRLVLGTVLFAVAVVATGPLFYAALVVGSIGVVTGLTGFCPTYSLLGISTVPRGTGDASAER